jgi:hypothetical protein
LAVEPPNAACVLRLLLARTTATKDQRRDAKRSEHLRLFSQGKSETSQLIESFQDAKNNSLIICVVATVLEISCRYRNDFKALRRTGFA